MHYEDKENMSIWMGIILFVVVIGGMLGFAVYSEAQKNAQEHQSPDIAVAATTPIQTEPTVKTAKTEPTRPTVAHRHKKSVCQSLVDSSDEPDLVVRDYWESQTPYMRVAEYENTDGNLVYIAYLQASLGDTILWRADGADYKAIYKTSKKETVLPLTVKRPHGLNYFNEKVDTIQLSRIYLVDSVCTPRKTESIYYFAMYGMFITNEHQFTPFGDGWSNDYTNPSVPKF